MTVTLVTVVCMLFTPSGRAVIETNEFSTPDLEQRYQELSQELRCPKCQNQTIADSNAPISKDLRQLLHRMLEQGASDEEILDAMVARYGEFVRYRPGARGVTMLLWLAPLLMLLLAAVIFFAVARGRSNARPPERPGESCDAGVASEAGSGSKPEARILSDEQRMRLEQMRQDQELRS